MTLKLSENALKVLEKRYLKKDENGSTVITNYHPEFLNGAANAAGGTFIPADATDKAARVKSALSTLRTKTRASLGSASSWARTRSPPSASSSRSKTM